MKKPAWADARHIANCDRPNAWTNALLAVVMFMGTLGYQTLQTRSDDIRVFLVALIGTTVALVLLNLALWLLHARTALHVFAVVLVVAVVRTLTVQFTASQMGLPPQGEQWPNLVGNMIITVIILLALLTIQSYFVSAQAQTQALLHEQMLIAEKQEQLAEANRNGRAAMSALISDVALPAIGESTILLNVTSQSGQLNTERMMAIAEQIRDRSEHEIRRLSHILGEASEPSDQLLSGVSAVAVKSKPVSVLTWPSWLRRVAPRCEIKAVATTILFAIVMSEMLVGNQDFFVGLLWLVECLALVFFITSLGQWGLSILRQHASAFSPLYLTLVFSVAGCAVLVARFNGEYSVDLRWPTAWTMWFSVVAIGWVCSLVSIADREQRLRQREIAALTTSYQLHAARLSHLLLATQRSAANILHSRVQGRFIAAAMTVGAAARFTADDAQEVEQQRIEALRTAVQILAQTADEIEQLQLDSGQPSENLAHALQAVGESWISVLRVKVQVGPSVDEQVSRYPGMSDWITDVVREAIANAARHGDAHHVEVDVSCPQPDRVRVMVNNDGLPIPANAETGLEAARVIDAGGTWALNAADDGVLLQVDLPLVIAQVA